MVNNELVTQPHVLRMIAEREELHAKIGLLSNFIEHNALFADLAAEEREDLRVQLDLMSDYEDVLSRRIDRANGHTVSPRRAASPEGIHPAPIQFSEDQLATDPILRYFHYAHLPEALKRASFPFCNLASHVVTTLPRNAERTVALRKLLEAKDAAVRANVQ